MSREQTAVKFAAFAVACSLKGDRLDPRDLARLEAQAAEQLEDTAPLRRAIEGWARQIRNHPGDRQRLIRLADQMGDYIQLLNQPVPPDADRKDIYG
ncbi:hypothetical protein P775_08325 [Puniceibacterium antarcticum]|uniref:Uncharacterized protein n=1 Tax=Puniceibacterium antarcticum TaxID=1206336 RepID=A0A2G8RG16_9RHOB|nr:hypothetical protein [Puniceibacterium antarcticum]PIL20525.1 hypothetical protein P775_08325 [Puniceibacterium antarcticum]